MSDLLDELAQGELKVSQVAADFRRRDWPKADRDESAAASWGVGDVEMPDPNSWEAVSSDSRLTVGTYAALSAAHRAAQG